MKQVVVFPLLALALTFGSAWGAKLLYLFVDFPYNRSGVFTRDGRLFTYYAWEALGRTSVTLSELNRPDRANAITPPPVPSPSSFEVPSYVRLPEGPDVLQLATGSYGFPWRCLKSEFVVLRQGATSVDTLPDQLLLSKTFQPQGRAFSLPLRPLWRGIVLNTVFWLIALVALRSTPARIIASVRRSRGHCPGCGYDLRGVWVDGCPECGWGRRNNQSLARPGEQRDGS